MAEFTKDFRDINKHDAAIAGGKGASLGEMTKAGIPVPPGFVITADTFDHFTKETDLEQEIRAILNTVDTDAVHTVDKASKRIQTLILEAKMPKVVADEIKKEFKKLKTKFVAVRSSATAEDSLDHAWAGQLDSFLNTTEKDLLETVKKCWASLFTPRAIFYRFEKGLHTTHISVAVVVQKMVNSEKSGIAFSVHPVTEDYNQIIIEAGFGLGEAIVSGQITPDAYVVSKKDNHIIDVNVNEQSRALYRARGGGNEWKELGGKGNKQVLSDKEVIELAKTIKEIENHYGVPQDIEWAQEKGALYITQSRPITTLSEKRENQAKKKSKKLNEKYVFLWGNYQGMQTIEDNISRYATCKNNPWNTARNIIEFSRRNQIECYEREDDVAATERVGRKLLDKKWYESFVKDMETAVAHSWKIYARLQKANIRNLSTKKILSLLHDAHDAWQRAIGYFDATHPGAVIGLMEQVELYVTPEELQEVITPSALDDVNRETIDWYALTRKRLSKKGLLAHARKYPWLASVHFTYEDVLKTLTSRYEFDAKHAKSPKIKQEKSALQKRHKAFAKKYPQLEQYFIRLRRLASSRMEVKAAWAGFDFNLIPVIAEISRRTGESVTDLNLYYRYDEIEMLLKDGKKLSPQTKKARKYFFVEGIKDGTLYWYQGKKAEKFTKKILGNTAFKKKQPKEFTGTIGFRGGHRGTARILHANDIARSRALRKEFKTGDILVTEMTQPNIMDIALRAGAIVTDEGSILSHAAVISREFKIPCVVGTHIATKAIKDGDLVEVDANEGVVRKI